MKYRTLGKTGLEVSVIGYGGSSLGGAFGRIDESEGIRSVHLALDHGINVIDTAPYYGATTAESVLGKALHGIPRDQYILATKVARYGPEPQDFDFSAQRVLQSIDESLARLGVDYVDLIQVHDIEFGHIPQIIEETIPALRRAQEAGKARFVGITGLHLKPILRVIKAIDVDQVQSYCHYCLNDDALIHAIPDLQAHGLGIFNSAPLAMRLLTNEGPPAWHPAPTAVRKKCAEAAEYCRLRGSDLGKLALQFSVGEPSIHTTVIGTANPEHIAKNIHDASQPLNTELLQQVCEILRPIHNISWKSGIPENND
jgi:L-galactose dehydrogenase